MRSYPGQKLVREKVVRSLSRLSLVGRLLRNASWLYLADLVGQAVGFAVTLFVARQYEVQDYGRIGLIIVYSETINQFIDFRIWETVINYYGAFWAHGELRKASDVLKLCYFIDSGSGLLAFIFVWLTANAAASLFIGDESSTVLIRLYSISLLLGTVNGTSTAFLRVHGKFSWLGLQRVVSSLAKLLLVTTLVNLRRTLGTIILAYVLTSLITALIINLMAWRLVRQELLRHRRVGTGLATAELRGILKFTVNTNVFGTLQYFITNANLLVVGLFATTFEVGLYRLATNLVSLPIQLMVPMWSVVYPDIVHVTATKDIRQLRALLSSATLFGMVGLGGAALGMALFADPILRWLLNKPEYIQAVPLMRIMLIGLGVHFSFFWLHALLVAYNRVTFLNLVQVMRGLLWLVGALILVPQLGGLGAAYLYALIWLFWVAALSLYVRHHQLLNGYAAM